MRFQLLLIASLFLLSILVYLSLGSIAMFFCSGWNEAHGARNMTCSVPGIAFFAKAGFTLGTLSSFSLGVPHFIAFGLSTKLARYYWMLLQLDPTSSLKPVLLVALAGSILSVAVFGAFLVWAIYQIFFN